MKPKFRIRDNGGESYDRYTIWKVKPDNGRITFFGFSKYPSHPFGFGQHGEARVSEWPRGHELNTLGKAITLDDLPPEARQAAERFINSFD